MNSKPTLFFGEILLRLGAPAPQVLLQSPQLEVHVGGAEANVAVGLASLGHQTSVISAVPDNVLGRSAVTAIRARGVDCRHIQFKPGRMGLYFLSPGASLRAPEIIYDRVGSSFALCTPDDFDWDTLLAGVGRLHLSGITPALGPVSADVTLAAARAARRLGIPISFDGNYRALLWERWDSNPQEILHELFGLADILFGNHRDISLVLGRTLSGDGPQRRRAAGEAAFVAFPNLTLIASTSRHVENADCHRIAARVDTPTEEFQTDEVQVPGIVDRIGAGDAFAAGVLHSVLLGEKITHMAKNGLALTCLKHSLPGDASLFTAADLAAFDADNLDVRR
ncbi:MAG: sugar kinase [Rhodocyclaceae bacterium]|nr:sugar kinase [Rhodocyclaceae bacterium]